MTRDEKVSLAKKLYLDGESTREIAERIGEKHGTVRSWATRNKWRQARDANVASSVAGVARKDEKVSSLSHEEKGLNMQQQLFCYEYVKTIGNGALAYRKAYPDVSVSASAKRAHALLKNPLVILEIERIKKEVKLFDLNDLKYLYNELMKTATADIGDVIKFMPRKVGEYDDGSPKVRNEIVVRKSEDIDTSVIESISQGRDGLNVKLRDREKAVKQIMEIAKFLVTHDIKSEEQKVVPRGQQIKDWVKELKVDEHTNA